MLPAWTGTSQGPGPRRAERRERAGPVAAHRREGRSGAASGRRTGRANVAAVASRDDAEAIRAPRSRSSMRPAPAPGRPRPPRRPPGARGPGRGVTAASDQSPADATGSRHQPRAERQEHQGSEQVRGIRLHVGRVADRVEARPRRSPRPAAAAPRGRPGPPRRGTATTSPPLSQREQPERPLRKTQKPDRRQLDPEEQRRADLAVVQRPEQVEVAAAEEVDGDERLVPPEGKVHGIASHA